MTVVLVPGFMLDADLWRDIEPGLSEFGPILHADLTRDDTLTTLAERALRDVRGTFILLGFSMGGYVAREMARLAPERVTALILVATSARGDTPVQLRRKQDMAARASDEAIGGLSRTAIAQSLHPDGEGSDALIECIRAMGRRLGGGAYRRQALLERGDERDRLGDIRCPTLVVAGERDRLRTRAEAVELRDGIADAVLEVIDGTGHMIPLEAPDRLVKVVTGWLSNKDGRA